jgi:hypothetical protein
MRRRAFLTGSTAAILSLAGCTDDPLLGSNDNPTNNPTGGGDKNQPTQRIPTNIPESKTVSTRAETATNEPNTMIISPQKTGTACGGVNEISFYALGEIGDKFWRRNTVWVDFNGKASAQVRLVVLENDTVLGMTQTERPADNSASLDRVPITLRTTLSGEHTIRVVVYPAAGEGDQFSPEEATPCQHEGNVVQTEPTTIDFSRFSESTSSTP